MERRIRTVIMGASGRDFHNFLVYFKDRKEYEVVAFTQSQIPGIENRKFPKELAGEYYRRDIPFFSEEKLPEVVKKYNVDLIVLAYSDLSHKEVMHKASLSLSLGCDFMLLGPKSTMIESEKPVISICAVRTGCGKSQTTRYVARILKKMGFKVAVVRHPMPYGDLREQSVQKFEKIEDFEKYKVTIEEMEEYEQHIKEGNIVYAGVDYRKILEIAERDCDIILWDGGNNDFPFFKPDLHIVLTDALRPNHELNYYPGETNLRMADVVIINKVDSSERENVEVIRKNVRKVNEKAIIFEAESPITLNPDIDIGGKRVLVVEDGPTLTHGGMKFGAGYLIAKKKKADIINPRLYAKGIIREFLEKYDLKWIVPAMGYNEEELEDLERTINSSACDYVIDASPVNLSRILNIKKEILQVRYELKISKDFDRIIMEKIKNLISND